jgi:hypothetical protein
MAANGDGPTFRHDLHAGYYALVEEIDALRGRLHVIAALNR